jgi:hypothetical protein
MQLELGRHMPLFMDHFNALLVSQDITPMDCVNVIFENNLSTCSQVVSSQ